MEVIRFHKNIELKNPVMIAGWPGMGSVALGAVDYLRRKLPAAKFAEIKVDPLTMLDSVVVNNGLAAFPPPPRNIFYYSKNPDLIIFEGEAQLHGPGALNLLNKVLDVASEFKTARIYTGAAFPLPISHGEPADIYAAANKKLLIDIIKKFGANPMDEGQISGLNGLMLAFARERNIDAVCLLATMPQYAIGFPNPKASLAIIEVLRKILGFRIDTSDLEFSIKDMDEKMSVIEERVKDVLITEKEEPKTHHTEKKIPVYITEKLEKLFKEARADKTKAIILKKELDRWDLYSSYEDRFLDLFKKS